MSDDDEAKTRDFIPEKVYFYFLTIGGPLGLLWIWFVIFPSALFYGSPESASWWTLGPVLHYAFSLYWSFSFFWNWRQAVKIGPGHPPKISPGGDHGGFGDDLDNPESLTADKLPNWCPACGCKKPSRTYHCKKCDVCVLRRDHHCGYLMTCIGQENQGYFIVGLFYFVLGGLHVLVPGFRHLFAVLASRGHLTWTLPVKVVFFHIALVFGYIDGYSLFNLQLTAFGCMALVVAVYVFGRQVRLVLLGLTGYELDRGQKKRPTSSALSSPDTTTVVLPSVMSSFGRHGWRNFREVFGPNVLLTWLWPFYSPASRSLCEIDAKQPVK